MKLTYSTLLAVTLTTVTAYSKSDPIASLVDAVVDTPVLETATGFLEGVKDLPVQPTLDARLRYEFREIEGLDAANSGTFRIRPGLKTQSFGGFSAAVEGEFNFAFIDNFNSSPNGSTSPSNVGGRTAIGDPETEELNQAYIQYSDFGVTLKVGRQAINLDEQQFVGGVAWRQNQQTFDAATLLYKNDVVDLHYSYVNQVNRIFGSDATGQVGTLEGDAHLINAKFTLAGQKIGAYAYLLELDDVDPPNNGFASSNTYGAFTSLKFGSGSLYLEGAYQTDAGDIQARGEYDDYYGHIKYGQKIGGVATSVGLINFGEDFVTPLQTAHKFNGFADAFLGNQIGLGNRGGNWDGLSDIYLSAVTKAPGGIKIVGALHYYLDSGFDDTYGYEADLVLIKKINSNLTGLIKAAYYYGDDDADNNFSNDIAQVTAQLDYKF